MDIAAVGIVKDNMEEDASETVDGAKGGIDHVEDEDHSVGKRNCLKCGKSTKNHPVLNARWYWIQTV